MQLLHHGLSVEMLEALVPHFITMLGPGLCMGPSRHLLSRRERLMAASFPLLLWCRRGQLRCARWPPCLLARGSLRNLWITSLLTCRSLNEIAQVAAASLTHLAFAEGTRRAGAPFAGCSTFHTPQSMRTGASPTSIAPRWWCIHAAWQDSSALRLARTSFGSGLLRRIRASIDPSSKVHHVAIHSDWHTPDGECGRHAGQGWQCPNTRISRRVRQSLFHLSVDPCFLLLQTLLGRSCGSQDGGGCLHGRGTRIIVGALHFRRR